MPTASPNADRDELRLLLTEPAAVCAALGLAATRQPGGVFIACPSHMENTPSCSITVGEAGTLRFRCFGCGAAGDVFSLIAAVHGLDVRRNFRGVLYLAAELAEIVGDAPTPPPPRRHVDRDPDDADRYNACARGLLHMLALDGPGREHLAERGLLGEAERDGWRYRQPSVAINYRTAHPDSALIIPWRDPDGRISTLQGRRLDGGSPKYVFPARRRPAWPYGSDAWRADDARPIVLTEGATDTLAVRILDRAHGLARRVLGLPGVTAWDPQWSTLVAGRVVSVAFDADAAGERAWTRLYPVLVEAGATQIKRMRPEGAKDFADMLGMIGGQRA